MSVLKGALAVTAVVLTLVPGGSANATPPSPWAAATYRCDGTVAGGRNWAIRQSNTNCAFARAAVQVVVGKRRSPKLWRCYTDQAGEFGPERRDYRVRCYRGTKRVLAIAQG